MAQITGGKYIYTRVVKDDDYGIKREFTAELTFNIGEDDPANDIGAAVAQKVVDITHEKLRVRGSAPATGTAAVEVKVGQGLPSPVTPPPAAAPVPQAPAAAPVPQAPAVSDKDKLAIEAGLMEAPKPPKKAGRPPKIAVAPVQEKSAEDELFGTATNVAAVNITDKELLDAIVAKNAVLKDPPRLVAFREKFAGPAPKQVRDIPQDKRAQFLKELAELK